MMRTLLFSCLLLLPCLSAWAAPGEAFTSAKEAGPDFALQGEYLGADNDNEKWGAHVIAKGDGKFDVVGYKGGLPGEGWSRGAEMQRGKGELKDGALALKSDDDHWTGTIKEGVFTVYNKDGGKVGELKKVERKSPTLGAKPPSGAIVLFDGTNVDAWDKGKLVEGNLLGATNCSTKQKFGDHTLHIEFRTPYMPKATGQGRGNSGVYIQGRYECQVLDSFGLKGENNECGGIYQIAAPSVNMCFPPLSWQTYDIEFKAAKYDGDKKTENARVTIKHNGVVIHDNLELPKGTPGHDPEGPGPDHIYLQDHGNPVAFRNIWVVEKK